VAGLLLTVLSSFAADRVDDKAEQRLLEVQTKQAATVLSTAIMLIQAPLSTALSLQPVAGPRDTAAFERFMAASVGPDELFVSASIWHREDGRLRRLAGIGSDPALAPGSEAVQDYLRRAFQQPTFTVREVSAGDQHRIAYAMASPASGYAVYAERTIPPDRRAPVDRDSAFADLNYAIYLGPRIDDASLSTTDMDPTTLPLTGRTATVTVPFGDDVLTLVASPRRHLGAPLSQQLPLMLLLGGVLLTLVAARVGHQLVRRREDAVGNAATIIGLYDQVETLYGQQRELFDRLQRALLPSVIPTIPHLETAAEYVAGAQGVDIGGDWYSIVDLHDGHFAFVVGDVSGRGVDTVAAMAQARFSLRAYLLQGDAPEVALEKCSRQFDISVDGHMVTTVVGVGDWRSGEVVVASAGHPPPLLIADEAVAFVDLAPGPPLGAGPTSYRSQTFTMPSGSTLFCYTDGLIERRTEAIDAGMRRLVDAARASRGEPVDALVSHVLTTLSSDDAADDVAVLAITWTGTA
jgi:serine phosphatase RsbU (regulator of sigma subunit)